LLNPIRKILILRDPPITTITPQPQPVPVGVFPLPPQLPPAPNPIVSGRPIDLVAGSVWIFAFQFAPKSPTGSYCGFRIKSGTMTLQGQSRQDSTGAVHIHTNDILTVTAELDAPAAPPPVTGPGADATATVVNLPGTVTIEFRHDGAHVTQLSTVSLTQSAEAATYDASSLRVLIPAVPGVPLFAIKVVRSTLFVPSGSAPVNKGAWALTISNAAVPQLGDAGGAGAVGLQLADGVSARWTGMAPAQKFSSGLVLAEAGRLIVILAYSGPRITQTLQLWQEASAARRSSVQVAYSAGASLRFGAGANRETVEFLGAEIAAHLDRPLKAGGTRLPLDHLSGAFVLNQDASGIQVGIQTAPSLVSQERIPFALRNALLITGGVRSLALTGRLQNVNVTDGLLSLSFALQSLLPSPGAVLARRLRYRRIHAEGRRIEAGRHARPLAGHRHIAQRIGPPAGLAPQRPDRRDDAPIQRFCEQPGGRRLRQIAHSPHLAPGRRAANLLSARLTRP
jgi:hypothetical protein